MERNKILRPTNKQRKKPVVDRPDPKKESNIKELSSLLEGSGIKVRREKLKRGHGWRVVSGSCRVDGDSMIFVDRRMSQDEQLSFLLGRARELALELPAWCAHESHSS